MKSILDNLKSDSFSSIKDTISSALQGNAQQAENTMERSYLDGLATALNIPHQTKVNLEQEVIEAKAQLAQG